MARLSTLFVQKVSKKGRYADGDGLYLQVTGTGVKSWLFRYKKLGRGHAMGLGSVKDISLSEARDLSREQRKILKQGADPIKKRVEIQNAQLVERSGKITFRECADQFIEKRKPTWKNVKHGEQWVSTLNQYANPVIGDMYVCDVSTTHILQILDPIWATKNETASRIRNRLELILSWAKVRGYRKGENPAAWRGHLDATLEKPSRLQRRQHFKAIGIDDVSKFVEELQKNGSMSAKGLEFLILTAARTREVLEATWAEINLERKVWTIPAERMKAQKEHRVALSDSALRILVKQKEEAKCPFIFYNRHTLRPLSSNAFLKLIKIDMKRNITAHGFRSSFCDWAAEQTTFPRDLVEMALAHTIKNKVEASYRRGDMLERRYALMNEWARHCYNERSKQADILQFHMKNGPL